MANAAILAFIFGSAGENSRGCLWIRIRRISSSIYQESPAIRTDVLTVECGLAATATKPLE
jgi:hypothetical protein